MSFEEFVDVVKDNLRDYLPDNMKDAEINTRQMEKLNSSYLGLRVRTEGQQIVPMVNLNALFDAFNRNGGDIRHMDRLLTSIADQVQSDPGFEINWLQDYNQVKDKLFVRVSDEIENASMLENIPYKSVDGLAVSYHIAFLGNNGIEGSVPVTNDLLKTYGISAEQLHTDALESAQKLNPPVIMSMAKMMSRMTGMDEEDLAPTVPGLDLMVLTNEQALYGASAFFYPDVMDTLAESTGSNYFILPSSVHETIILADDGTADRRELESMVQEINQMVVAPEDRLSDNVYHYDAQDHVLEKAATYEHRMEQKELQAEKAGMEATFDHFNTGSPSDREDRSEDSGKERKSVLSRLNEKKDMVKSQPKKDTPQRSRTAEIE